MSQHSEDNSIEESTEIVLSLWSVSHFEHDGRICPLSVKLFFSLLKHRSCLLSMSLFCSKPPEFLSLLPILPDKLQGHFEQESKLLFPNIISWSDWLFDIFNFSPHDFFTSPFHAFKSFSFLFTAFCVLLSEESTPTTFNPYCNAKFWLR